MGLLEVDRPLFLVGGASCSSESVNRFRHSISWTADNVDYLQTTANCTPAGANVHSHEGTLAPPDKYNWTCASFGSPKSPTQTANRSVQLFLHSWWQSVAACPGMSFHL